MEYTAVSNGRTSKKREPCLSVEPVLDLCPDSEKSAECVGKQNRERASRARGFHPV